VFNRLIGGAMSILPPNCRTGWRNRHGTVRSGTRSSHRRLYRGGKDRCRHGRGKLSEADLVTIARTHDSAHLPRPFCTGEAGLRSRVN